MAILEKQIMVTINGNNKYYEEKGYDVPRYIDKKGRKSIKKGTKILVNIEDLPLGSHMEVTKICDICEEECKEKQPYSAIIRSREINGGIDRCENCGHNMGGQKRKNNVKYEDSLEYYSKNNDKEYLLNEFSKRNNKTPSQISKCTNDIYWWDCHNCGSEFDTAVSNRTNSNSNCPYCASQKVNHTNCLWTTRPDIAKLLTYHQRGYEVTDNSKSKESFTCPECNNAEDKIVSDVSNRGLSCNNCSDGILYPEKFMISVLSQLDIKFEKEKIFDWLNDKRYDFYIEDSNCIIETHGIQHYEDSNRGRTLEEEQENDRLKEGSAKENGIEKYIVIDCRYSELEWIKNNIFNSDLNRVFDLSNVNWEKCHEFSCKSLIKEVCNLWDNGINSVSEISKIVNLGRSTVNRYLNQGTKLGWCNYDPKETQRIGSKKRSKKVVQLSLNGVFIKEWDSMSDVQMELNIKANHISNVCNGKAKTTGGFIWIFKESYSNL